MKTITSELQRFRGTACVTITLKTHRTHPENKQDSIQLKNLIKTAERRLAEEYDQSVASERVAQLEKLAEQIDFDRNLDGLREKIPGLLDFSGGPYSSPEGLNQGFTHGFIMTFADEASRDAYLPHPDHEVVKQQILAHLDGGLEAVAAFDWLVQ